MKGWLYKMKDMIEIIIWFAGLLRGFFAILGQGGIIDELTSRLQEVLDKKA